MLLWWSCHTKLKAHLLTVAPTSLSSGTTWPHNFPHMAWFPSHGMVSLTWHKLVRVIQLYSTYSLPSKTNYKMQYNSYVSVHVSAVRSIAQNCSAWSWNTDHHVLYDAYDLMVTTFNNIKRRPLTSDVLQVPQWKKVNRYVLMFSYTIRVYGMHTTTWKIGHWNLTGLEWNHFWGFSVKD